MDPALARPTLAIREHTNRDQGPAGCWLMGFQVISEAGRAPWGLKIRKTVEFKEPGSAAFPLNSLQGHSYRAWDAEGQAWAL